MNATLHDILVQSKQVYKMRLFAVTAVEAEQHHADLGWPLAVMPALVLLVGVGYSETAPYVPTILILIQCI